ncbi:hypothetical protein KQX54_000142, partial [Cotesia glomerata]
RSHDAIQRQQACITELQKALVKAQPVSGRTEEKPATDEKKNYTRKEKASVFQRLGGGKGGGDFQKESGSTGHNSGNFQKG